MRRDAKGPRLWLRTERRNSAGRTTHSSEWIIRDGARQRRTGCGPDDRAEAERQLADYIAAKYQPGRTLRDPARIPVADVIGIYLSEKVRDQARLPEVAARAERLLAFFGDKMLGDITGQMCRAYAADRGKQASARRELEDLRAAIRFHWMEGMATAETKIVLPPKPQARERYLTRGEAARLLWAAWRLAETQNGRKTPKRIGKHVARFILVGLYTGTRSSAICEASIGPGGGSGYVDVELGIFARRAEGELETKKRRPPVALSRRLLAHVRRWIAQKISIRYVVERRGQPVRRVTHGFRAAVKAAGLETKGPRKVTPHTLRHTAATWGMQAGADPWHLAQALGMSLETLLHTYGHWHPEHGREAMEAVARRRA